MSTDLTDDTTAIPNDGMSRREVFDPIPVNAETNALYGRVHDTVKRAAPDILLRDRYAIALDITRLILDSTPMDIAFLLARVEQAEQRLAAVIALHKPMGQDDFWAGMCAECSDDSPFEYPCPTVVLASEGQDTE